MEAKDEKSFSLIHNLCSLNPKLQSYDYLKFEVIFITSWWILFYNVE